MFATFLQLQLHILIIAPSLKWYLCQEEESMLVNEAAFLSDLRLSNITLLSSLLAGLCYWSFETQWKHHAKSKAISCVPS